MSYLATVTNSVIDTTDIKNLIVQGETAHPTIVFSLAPALTGLSWKVRMTYLSFNLSVESVAIVPTEGAEEVAVSWTPDASFTTLYGAAQLVLVGTSGSSTVVRAIGYVNIARDWSGESAGTITLDLFEQIIAQARAAIANYPYIDETTGNWFVWNPNTSQYDDTEIHAQGETGATGSTGATGAGVAVGGTTDQALVKTSGTNYATGWVDISTERTATLAAGSWSGSSAPYSQAVTITGVTTTGKPPIIDVVLSDTYLTAVAQLTAYSKVFRFKVTGDNTVTAYASEVPATDIDIHAKLVR